MTVYFKRAAIIGVGMVGGSLGKAVLKRQLVQEVVGFDRTQDVLSKALAVGAVTETTTSLQAALSQADLVVLAAPVLATLQLLPKIAPYVKAGAVVTDVCSTKAAVTQQAAVSLPAAATFIGGHPMAGSEKQGVEAADENLFENAIYFLTGKASPALAIMERLICELGAVPLILEPQQHDQRVAAISHLPHLVATALVQQVAGLEEAGELLVLAAGGFRDTTRVAMGSPQMWKDICLTNGENIVPLLERFISEMQEVRSLVAAGSADDLLSYFEEARSFRVQVPLRGKGLFPFVYNMFVYVPDRPGIIGEVAGLVGRSGINIAEIELLRSREEEGGPLRLGFMSKEGRQLAAGVLTSAGFRVQLQEG